MGASGSGKTSMRSLILYVPFACSLTRMPMNPLHSSNNPASLTSRLGATIDVEQNHVRFLGDLILNLWDCGGQDAFMDSYLSTQRSTIFQHVGAVQICDFEVSAHDAAKDAAYSSANRENSCNMVRVNTCVVYCYEWCNLDTTFYPACNAPGGTVNLAIGVPVSQGHTIW